MNKFKKLKQLFTISICISLLYSCSTDDLDQEKNNIDTKKKRVTFNNNQGGVLYDDMPSFNNNLQSKYDVSGTKWKKNNLTYYFYNSTNDISTTDQQEAIKQAFKLWEYKTNLDFSEVYSLGAYPDIIILFDEDDHGDGFPFDGPGSLTRNILAHAFSPPQSTNSSTLAGDIHFDDFETWTIYTRNTSSNPRDLVTIAAHEIGHSLGLRHSTDPNALMYSYYFGSHRYLHEDDIEGIQSIYGDPGVLDYSQWASQQGEYRDHHNWIKGDFNGDGKEDLAKAFYDQGKTSIDVHLSDGSSIHTWQRWATRQGGYAHHYKWVAGDFNGDGKDDIAKAFYDQGKTSIDAHLSNGSSIYTWGRWATRQGGYSENQRWLAGDFNGDGKDDIAKAFYDQGRTSIDVHVSDGKRINTWGRWATRQGGFSSNQRWMTGDFNGDGKDDFAKAFYDQGKTSIDVHLSAGNRIGSWNRWATRQGGFSNNQRWMAGDFNGDGKDDFAKAFYDVKKVSIDVHISSGSNIQTWQRWASKQGKYHENHTWLAGDYDGDGKDDFAKIFNENGKSSIMVHKLND